jgi:hypothetical protein
MRTQEFFTESANKQRFLEVPIKMETGVKDDQRDHTCLSRLMDYSRKKIGIARSIPVLIGLLVLVACQEGISPSQSNPLMQTPRSAWSSIQNPSNPYNYIGEAHNNGLDYFGEVFCPGMSVDLVFCHINSFAFM